MYKETGCFDPINSTAEGAYDGFPQPVDENLNLSTDQFSFYHQEDAAAVSTMGLDLQHHLLFNTHWMQQVVDVPNQLLSYHHSIWDTDDIGFDPQQTPDLLNLFHLPNSNHDITPLSFIGDLPPSDSNPQFHPNLRPQPPLFRELLQSIPHGYSLATSGGGGTEFQVEDGGRLESTRETGKRTKNFVTDRERRESLNDRFKILGSLFPNPTKSDRASVVGDAIEYIKKLLRTVDELKLLVEKKRSCGRERSVNRHKTDQDDAPDQSENNGSLWSSWIQRKSKDTEVDVRVIDDQVTITLLQRKKMDCLLLVSKVLDELQLDLHHVAGGQIGDHYSFLFNTKTYEGSSVYAGAIANKLIEVMDTEYAATRSY